MLRLDVLINTSEFAQGKVDPVEAGKQGGQTGGSAGGQASGGSEGGKGGKKISYNPTRLAGADFTSQNLPAERSTRLRLARRAGSPRSPMTGVY